VVLVTYAACGYSWPHGAPDYLTHAHGPGQWELPYGPSTVATYALAARRHMHDYGTTAEDLAAIAVQCRANAAANPDARYTAPICVDDVLASPVIADPLHRLDCCVVTDSGGAFVLASARRARSMTARPAYVLGFGEALGQVSMSQMWPYTATAAAASGVRAFQTAGLRPAEIDCAQLYTVVRRTPNAEFAAGCPYVLAIIELDEGPRMTARIVGNADGLACDQRVHAVFSPVGAVGAAGVLPNFALDRR
jgi:acetyl-CoA C-acetyltransferase